MIASVMPRFTLCLSSFLITSSRTISPKSCRTHHTRWRTPFINVADPTLKDPENQVLEVHRRYIDVHFPLTSEETIGWSPMSVLTTESVNPFNEEDDYAIYAEQAQSYHTIILANLPSYGLKMHMHPSSEKVPCANSLQRSLLTNQI